MPFRHGSLRVGAFIEGMDEHDVTARHGHNRDGKRGLPIIVYGLMTPEKWNAKFNPTLPPDAAPGHTNWFTIAAIVLSLLMGTTVLMSSIVFSFQRYFEYQIEEARKISQ